MVTVDGLAAAAQGSCAAPRPHDREHTAFDYCCDRDRDRDRVIALHTIIWAWLPAGASERGE